MARWYYQKGDQRIGPLSAGELREAASTGQITPDDFVLKEGMSEWVTARKIAGLFAPQRDLPATPSNPPTHAPPLPPLNDSQGPQFPQLNVGPITTSIRPQKSKQLSGTTAAIIGGAFLEALTKPLPNAVNRWEFDAFRGFVRAS